MSRKAKGTYFVGARNVLQDSSLGRATKEVFYGLASFAPESQICYPSKRAISQRIGMDRREVQRHLKILEERGHITRNHRVTPKGRSTSTQYNLVFAGSKPPEKKFSARPRGNHLPKGKVEPPKNREGKTPQTPTFTPPREGGEHALSGGRGSPPPLGEGGDRRSPKEEAESEIQTPPFSPPRSGGTQPEGGDPFGSGQPASGEATRWEPQANASATARSAQADQPFREEPASPALKEEDWDALETPDTPERWGVNGGFEEEGEEEGREEEGNSGSDSDQEWVKIEQNGAATKLEGVSEDGETSDSSESDFVPCEKNFPKDPKAYDKWVKARVKESQPARFPQTLQKLHPIDRERLEEIYAAYPVKKGRQTALASIYRALTYHSYEHLLERTKRFAEVRGGNREYCPNPSTWFNQGRFDDDESSWAPNYQGISRHQASALMDEKRELKVELENAWEDAKTGSGEKSRQAWKRATEIEERLQQINKHLRGDEGNTTE